MHGENTHPCSTRSLLRGAGLLVLKGCFVLPGNVAPSTCQLGHAAPRRNHCRQPVQAPSFALDCRRARTLKFGPQHLLRVHLTTLCQTARDLQSVLAGDEQRRTALLGPSGSPKATAKGGAASELWDLHALRPLAVALLVFGVISAIVCTSVRAEPDQSNQSISHVDTLMSLILNISRVRAHAVLVARYLTGC